MRIWGTVTRWMAWLSGVGFLVLGLGGCLFAVVPAIPDPRAEDLGAEMAYRIYAPPGDKSAPGKIRWVRTAGAHYRMVVESQGEAEAPADQPELPLVLRRLGERHGGPVYLVQMNLSTLTSGRPYFIYLVNISEDGTGYTGLLDCRKPDLAERARVLGLVLRCEGPTGRPMRFAESVDQAQSDAFGRFLGQSFAAGDILWEDDAKVSFWTMLP